MFEVIKPPAPIGASVFTRTVFLSGSIEMGGAEDWQSQVTQMLKESGEALTVFNPRRDDWDSSWVQSIDNPQFRRQVEWEIKSQEFADIIFMHFEPGTKSPITLLELGLFAHSGKLIVHCPEGFWRKGNVDIVCEHVGIETVATLEDGVDAILGRIRQ